MHNSTVSNSQYVGDCAVPSGYSSVAVEVSEEITNVHVEKIEVSVKWTDKGGQAAEDFETYQIPNMSAEDMVDYCLKEAIARQGDYDRENGTEIEEENQGGGGGLSPT